MEKLEYGIKTNGRILAAFLIEYDRDIAIGNMREEFDDCEFEAVEIE